MIHQDKPHFAALLTTIGEIYQTPIKSTITELYWQAFKEYAWQEVEMALKQHVLHPKQGRFFPKPADIISLLHEKVASRAERAWEKVARAIHELGVYRTVAFDDPIIHCVLNQLISWVPLCQSTQKQLLHYAKRFQIDYILLAKTATLPHYPPYFRGLVAMNNGQEEKPHIVGDDKKAIAILQDRQKASY